MLKPRTDIEDDQVGLQPPSGGCVLKPKLYIFFRNYKSAATFGWLCVETALVKSVPVPYYAATFGWLCVETTFNFAKVVLTWQPPSGGCVLKLYEFELIVVLQEAATFGWLCVETKDKELSFLEKAEAATFGWLCVETEEDVRPTEKFLAATFGWLCVETFPLSARL